MDHSEWGQYFIYISVYIKAVSSLITPALFFAGS